MDSCELNAKEIMCIAASLGATELCGIPDSFGGMSEAALSHEILGVQTTLERKGYLKENFDGETSLSGDILNIVEICAKCEKFIAVDKQLRHNTQEGILFYIKDAMAVMAVKDGESYKLKVFDTSKISETVFGLINLKNNGAEERYNYRISNKTLEKAKKLKTRNADDAALKELTSAGADAKTAKIIVGGFVGDEDFYSFTFADLKAETDNVDNIMYIMTAGEIIRLKSIMENEEDVVYFQNATKEGIQSEMREMLKKLNISREVFE